MVNEHQSGGLETVMPLEAAGVGAKAQSLNFLNQLKFKYENGKFKRKAGPAIGPRGSPPALYISSCRSFETLQEGH